MASPQKEYEYEKIEKRKKMIYNKPECYIYYLIRIIVSRYGVNWIKMRKQKNEYGAAVERI